MWYINQYQQYQIFCQTRGLTSSDLNSFILFYQQMILNKGHQQPLSPHQPLIPQNPPFIANNNGNERYIPERDLNDLSTEQDKETYINKNQSEMINIKFKSGSQYNDINLTIPENITISQMFKRYEEKLGISHDDFQNNFFFCIMQIK